MTVMRKISELQLYPFSEDLYGGASESVQDLVKSIGQVGILHDLITTTDGFVLSGNRRLKAARELGLAEVPCVILDPATEEEARMVVIEANKYRNKSLALIHKEAQKLTEAIGSLAKKRQLAGLKQNLLSAKSCTSTVMSESDITTGATNSCENSPAKAPNPTTRKAVADILGVKEHMLRSLNYLSDLAAAGNAAASESLSKVYSGEMALSKAVTTVRAAVRKEMAQAEGREPEGEPTQVDIWKVDAEKHARALLRILNGVIQIPDDEFNSVPWMVIKVFLEEVAKRSDQLETKISRKFVSTLDDIRSNPEKQAAFIRGDKMSNEFWETKKETENKEKIA